MTIGYISMKAKFLADLDLEECVKKARNGASSFWTRPSIAGAVAFFLVLLSLVSASGADSAKSPAPKLYLGAGINQTHHTWYDPNDPEANAEEWVTGGKLFLGIQLFDQFGMEATYYYLSKAPIRHANRAIKKSAKSYAISLASVISYQPFSGMRTHPTLKELRLFVKGGGVFKHIKEFNQPGITETEDGFSWMTGAGVEGALGRGFFLRGEYEYLERIGTTRAINLKHTPVTISLLKRF